MNGASSDLTQKSNQIPMAEISGSAGSGDGYAYQNHTPINSSTEHYKHGMSSPPKPKSSPLKPSKSSSMSPKPAKLSSSSQNGHHNKHKSSHSSDGERHKSGHHSDKPRDPQSKPKDPNARPKDHSSHHHSSSSKPKDPFKHSSSSSSSSKHKDGSIKPREGSSTTLKEGSQSSSTSKHKDSSSKHKDGSSSKPKEGSSSSSRPKDGSSSSGHKPSSSSKHKDHSSKSSDASRHKEHSSGSSFTSSGSSSTKPVSKESSKHAESSDKKIRDESGKHKLAKKSGDKHKTDKHREKSSADGVKVKSESMSPTKLVIKTEKVDSHRPQIKKEAGESDDDIPLASRAQLAAGDFKVKKEKRRHESGSEDDESLASRAEKIKKQKTEVSVKKESKKRKMERDEDYDVKKKKDKTKKGSVKEEPPKKKAKKEKEVEEVWKWWEETPHPEGVKWMTLSHRGPVFAPEYEPLPDDVKFYYDGKLMKLGLAAEEVAGFYARMLDHDYTTKAVFNKNFFKDWRKEMTHEEKATIVDLKKCDFREIRDYYLQKSEERKNMSKAEKDAIKKKNEEIVSEYGFCIIDGHKQKIGNFKIEPPGLFRGRGDHPKQGMLKKRLQPEDVTINVGKDAEVPAPPKGHKWKEVIHDNKVTWLASWSENIQGANKYVMLNANSRLKGEKDWQKYETARKLKSLVDKIRENYKEDWRSKEMRIRQRAVALYFIDKLALRAGNEKEEGETADTVGCCSLRVEHITLHQEYQGKEFVVGFDFLGKDSIRYVNHVPVEKRVFKNLQLFMENKQPGDDLFDRLNTSILNKHLQELMEGLTAKVFRTFNASKTLQEQLNELTEPDDSVPAKILAYNRANRAVAILCNHQRAAPKTFDKQMSNLQEKIEKKHVSIKDVKKEYKRLKSDYKTSRDDRMKSALERKKKQLERLEEQLMKLEVQATDKEENKEIALGTSKLNYLDPRISVAWCKKWNVPLEKIYNRTQRDKFQWAIDMADETYEF
ncbi:DNA topoisomerase I, mitochondrial-like [Ptychodera flava]|uniref:DNA topoisomerase I, mitochondrial-like n=1 Tax=Ptychodera flava TaxID=63121 RepID=UPI003969C859